MKFLFIILFKVNQKIDSQEDVVDLLTTHLLHVADETTRHSTFFIWDLIVDFTSWTLATMFSLCVSREGNLTALFRPGPRDKWDLLDETLPVLVQDVVGKFAAHGCSWLLKLLKLEKKPDKLRVVIVVLYYVRVHII